MRYIKLFLITALFAPLLGCSHVYGDRGVLKNHERDYLKAQSIPPMRIPPGLSSSNIQTIYPVPEKQYPANQVSIGLIPPGLNTSGK